jgi:hypothetical protein
MASGSRLGYDGRTMSAGASASLLPADDRPSAAPSSARNSHTSSWTSGQRVAFRFGVIYFVAYALLNGNVATLPLAFIAPHGQVPDWYMSSTNAVWSALGRAIGLQGQVRAFDNGDSIGDHIQLLSFVLVAAVGTAAWSLLDRKRVEYRREFGLLSVAVRYMLAMTVFAYAIFKVFSVQFSVPSPTRLAETYGTSSRMGLLWTFMGTSPGYQMFAGWTEVLGCALLMARRTTALGALILIAILWSCPRRSGSSTFSSAIGQ